LLISPDRRACAFVELADNLVEDFDVVELLARLAERCVELFGATAAGILLADELGALRLIAATSEQMEIVELFQLQNAEGPCFEAFHGARAVHVDDLRLAGGRWPGFAPVALDAGFRSAHALPLRLRGRVLGALNLFAAVPGPLEPVAALAAQGLADVATIAILQHRAASDARQLTEQLQIALTSRVTVEQAKGIVFEQARLDMDGAFALLREHARRSGRLLSEVAGDVVRGALNADDMRA
jgi:GAF domain-containing protein